MHDIEERIRVENILDEHRQEVGEMVETRLAGGRKEIFGTRWREVAECFLARNTSLYFTMTMSPILWTGTAAPLLLRTMIDVMINMRYIAQDPVKRAQDYIDHGLSEALNVAAKFEEESFESEDEMFKSLFEKAAKHTQAFVEAERAVATVDVRRGDWAKNNARTRAKEIGLDKLYDVPWAMFSGCIHSNWHHIGRYNGKRCINPLHRGHIVGHIGGGSEEWSWDYLYRAAKYLDMTVETHEEAFGISEQRISVREACIKIGRKYREDQIQEIGKEEKSTAPNQEE